MRVFLVYFITIFSLQSKSAELKTIQVGLASNFSEVSTGSSNRSEKIIYTESFVVFLPPCVSNPLIVFQDNEHS